MFATSATFVHFQLFKKKTYFTTPIYVVFIIIWSVVLTVSLQNLLFVSEVASKFEMDEFVLFWKLKRASWWRRETPQDLSIHRFLIPPDYIEL